MSKVKPVTRNEFLEEMRLLIKKGWSQNVSARNQYRVYCDPRDESACEWSIGGASTKVLHDFNLYAKMNLDKNSIYFQSLKALDQSGMLSSQQFGTLSSQEDALSWIDRAMELPQE